jgi:hypothetical protein
MPRLLQARGHDRGSTPNKPHIPPGLRRGSPGLLRCATIQRVFANLTSREAGKPSTRPSSTEPPPREPPWRANRQKPAPVSIPAAAVDILVASFPGQSLCLFIFAMVTMDKKKARRCLGHKRPISITDPYPTMGFYHFASVSLARLNPESN